MCGGAVIAHSPVYVGIFLDEDSKKTLLEYVRPIHPNVFGEHLTLAFGRHMLESYSLGIKVDLDVFASIEDERGQCVLVKPDPLIGLIWEKQDPHITISCADEIKPIYSNALIKNGLNTNDSSTTQKPISLHLTGVLDYFPRLAAHHDRINSEFEICV